MIFAFRYGGDALDYFVIIILTLLAVCIALVLHELAHGLVAKWNGDYTAKYAGRLTLNPLKHFDLIGFLMMMLVGFGYAKPVPVNPYNFKHRRRGMVTVAIAGVVVNLILAFFASLFFCLMVLAINHATTDGTIRLCWYAIQFFRILATINISLLFFNILPIFPLDGFRVVEALTRAGNRFCAFMRANGQYILWGLVGLSFIVSSAATKVSNIPSWFEYLDVLGTYLNFFVTKLLNLFTSFWGLMIPVY
ncbi:MAG: site-2 protease family protein [Clostridiales bacterium]|nr:site-2 protease family protein [Clostridiales bacterium]